MMPELLSTRIAQRKRMIPQLSVVITLSGAPRTGKEMCACTSDLGDASHVTC